MIDRSLMFKLSYWFLKSVDSHDFVWFLFMLFQNFGLFKMAVMSWFIFLHITYFKVFIKLFSEMNFTLSILIIDCTGFLPFFFLKYLFLGGCAGSSLQCTGFSLWWPLVAGSGAPASVVVAHGLSCCEACWIFLDQGSNPCLLYQLPDSQPQNHQGSPSMAF